MQRQPEAEQGERDAGREDVPPGADRERRGVLRVVEHDAPGDGVRVAEAEELERRLGDDGEDDAADEVDADDRDEVREDLEGHDAPARLAQHLGRLDEVALPERQRLRARDARAPGPRGEAEDDGDDERARLADEGREHQQQRQVGDDEDHVGEEA